MPLTNRAKSLGESASRALIVAMSLIFRMGSTVALPWPRHGALDERACQPRFRCGWHGSPSSLICFVVSFSDERIGRFDLIFSLGFSFQKCPLFWAFYLQHPFLCVEKTMTRMLGLTSFKALVVADLYLQLPFASSVEVSRTIPWPPLGEKSFAL